MALTTDATTAPRPNRTQRRDIAKLPMFVRELITKLGLDVNRRYDQGALRVSSKGDFDALEDQQGTGVNVFADNKDFQALAGMKDVRERGWLPVTYRDVGGTKTSVFAWVGVVGNTIFVAAADSAAEANIPPHPDDIHGVGRNAYVELFIACARAGHVENILLPFLSRIWRNDLWPEMLMATINRHLPGCTVWNGNKQLATYGSEKLTTGVEGRQSTGYVETLKEQVFEKGVNHISVEGGGQWDRRESELPLGLARKRVVQLDGLIKKSFTVVESEWRPVAAEALAKRADGASHEAIGEFLAEKGAPMRGTRARGRTFAEYSSKSARTAGARAMLSGEHLDYYRTGEWDEVRTVGLPNLNIRGIELDFDPDTGRRMTTVRIKGMPWKPFLTPQQWEAFDKVEAAEAAKRNQGKAAHDRKPGELVSPFQGVSSYIDDGLEHVLVPDSATAYRWRTRKPEDRGWDNNEGTIEATLRRTLFHASFGRAFLEALRTVEDSLAPAASTVAGDDPLSALEDGIARLEAEIQMKERASARADKELAVAEGDEDDDEVVHWREQGRKARAELRQLRADLAAAKDRIAAAATEVVETVETEEADIAEAVLVASLLLDGGKLVEPVVFEALRDYGVLRTLRLARTGAQMVRATATAHVPLLDGTKHEVVVTWETPDSHNTTGDGALVPAMVRLWAAGHSFDDVASQFPGHDADRVRRGLRQALKRAGIAAKTLRTAALKCPIAATRAVIASVVVDDAELAAPYSSEFCTQVKAAYFGNPTRRRSTWADTTTLREVRRVLDALTHDLDGLGANADLLARNANVAQALIRDFARDGLLQNVGALALRAKRCGHSSCGGLLTIYLPAPETGSGLICGRCWRPEGLAVALPGEYAERWVRSHNGCYVVEVRQAVTPVRPERDRLLTTAEAAELLGISTSGVRHLDKNGELAPTSRRGANRGRLYSPATLDAIPAETLARWQERFNPDGVRVARAEISSGRSRSRTSTSAERVQIDGLLTTTEAAERLGITASGIRQLDRDGELAPASRLGINGGRLYSPAALDTVPADMLARWRERFGPAEEDGLLTTADAAALLECSPALVRDMRRAGVLIPVATTGGGHSRYRREDVDAVDRDGIRAYDLAEIGAAAEAVGLPSNSLRKLTEDGLVPCSRTILGHRRFDIDALRAALAELDLLGTPDNPIVSIGDLADHPEVQLSVGQVRRLTNDGVIRQAGRLGDKRRYRVQDALHDLRAARKAGTAPSSPEREVGPC